MHACVCAPVSQLLRGGSEELLCSLHLQNDPAVYTYTREGAATAVSNIEDAMLHLFATFFVSNLQKFKADLLVAFSPVRPPTMTAPATGR